MNFAIFNCRIRVRVLSRGNQERTTIFRRNSTLPLAQSPVKAAKGFKGRVKASTELGVQVGTQVWILTE
jgi:hypothetical protein